MDPFLMMTACLAFLMLKSLWKGEGGVSLEVRIDGDETMTYKSHRASCGTKKESTSWYPHDFASLQFLLFRGFV
jgi:hypothetical protein